MTAVLDRSHHVRSRREDARVSHHQYLTDNRCARSTVESVRVGTWLQSCTPGRRSCVAGCAASRGLPFVGLGSPTTMPWRRAAAAPRGALLFAVAATAQGARDFDFCGTYAFSEWTNFNGVPPDGGGFAFGSTDPITGAGCRASTTTAVEDTSNAIWLYENQEQDDEEEDGEEENSDYSVEVTGRPEITGEAGGWAVLLRAHGWDASCFGS